MFKRQIDAIKNGLWSFLKGLVGAAILFVLLVLLGFLLGLAWKALTFGASLVG